MKPMTYLDVYPAKSELIASQGMLEKVMKYFEVMNMAGDKWPVLEGLQDELDIIKSQLEDIEHFEWFFNEDDEDHIETF